MSLFHLLGKNTFEHYQFSKLQTFIIDIDQKKAFKGTVVNRALSFLHGRSLETILSPFHVVWTDAKSTKQFL